MHDGHICIAGLDRATGHHIRPVTGGRIPLSFLDRPGGTIQIGSILHFTAMLPQPSAPEVEDHFFRAADCDVSGLLGDRDLWAMLKAAECTNLGTVFGPDLHREGRTWALDEGKGAASLGIISPRQKDGPVIDRYGKVRMAFLGDDGDLLTTTVTDLRLFEVDVSEPNRAAISHMKRRVDQDEVLLSVGVGRAWAPDGQTPKHWLQVNNIHIKPGLGR